jgi:hypothetical protein
MSRVGIMMKLETLIMIVAASYITLGLANSDKARELWAVYAGIMLALATINFVLTVRRNK